MADLVQTAANVAAGAGSGTIRRTAGATITAGMPVFVSAVDGDVEPAQKDVDAASAEAIGIALCDAAAGQPVVIQTSGLINVGATLVVGETYIVGAAAGSIAPVADAVATNFATVLGVAISTSQLKLGINASGVAHG